MNRNIYSDKHDNTQNCQVPFVINTLTLISMIIHKTAMYHFYKYTYTNKHDNTKDCNVQLVINTLTLISMIIHRTAMYHLLEIHLH